MLSIPRYKKIILFTIVGLSITLSFLMLSQGHEWGDDFASYLMQTQSIADGKVAEFIQKNSFTIDNSILGLGPIAYPWGYPLLLTPLYALFGLNLFALKCLSIVLFTLFMFVLFALFQTKFSRHVCYLFLSILAFHPILLPYLNQLCSDIPYLCISTLCVLLIDRCIILTKYEILSRIFGQNLLIGTAIFLAYQIRTSGIILLMLLFFCQIIEYMRKDRNKKKLKVPFVIAESVPYVVFVLLWLTATSLLPDKAGSYTRQLHFDALFSVILFNINYYAFTFAPNIIIPGIIKYPFLIAPFLIVSLPLVAAGVVATIKKEYHLFFYTALTIGLYLVWPGQDSRLLFPLLPFFYYFILKGGGVVCRWLHKSTTKRTAHTIAVIGLYGFILICCAKDIKYIQEKAASDKMCNGPFCPESTALFTFIQNNTKLSDVVGFYKPRVLRLLTQRNAFTLWQCNQLQLADFVIIDKTNTRSDQLSCTNSPECCQNHATLQRIYESGPFTMFKITKVGQNQDTICIQRK
ncbi:MAG: hypothetical protein JW795_12965 [Chitinivibrionales bacterium]|nr:hypothetical protein [Chitinivibrionales bacterium]